MALIVQKYGGTSVGDCDRIKSVARRIQATRDAGNQVVVVVSAMSGVTDRLIELAKQISPLPNEREMDVLLSTGEQTTIALTAMALQSLGVKAASLTGAQAGIVTDKVHTKARISALRPKRVEELLNRGDVVIVAGFQGVTEDDRITTLGRGGSDLTAIALAAALKADLCQIFTDVDGIYTADPRIVPDARKMTVISYDELLEMAAAGSKVMQARSVEFAKKYNVVFEVRSSMNDHPGTLVAKENKDMEDVVIRGVSLDKKQVKVTIERVPDRPGLAARIFKELAGGAISVDMIVQNASSGGEKSTDVSFTVSKDDLAKSLKLLEPVAKDIQAGALTHKANVAMLSVVGIGMKSHSGVAAAMFEALGQAGVNIEMISTSEIKISVIIGLEDAEKATKVVHDKFNLGKS
ncbi:MAG: aspartate kinase, partial [Verrucomicrobiae bacterium]|nr:aspartate kinase [Verrucomicrobiae bacterium]